jgi:hypothetical protein
VVINSARVGLAKPDVRIFHLAAERLGVPASACVFTDDLAHNVEGARAAGMRAFQFQDAAHLESELRALGVEWADHSAARGWRTFRRPGLATAQTQAISLPRSGAGGETESEAHRFCWWWRHSGGGGLRRRGGGGAAGNAGHLTHGKLSPPRLCLRQRLPPTAYMT